MFFCLFSCYKEKICFFYYCNCTFLSFWSIQLIDVDSTIFWCWCGNINIKILINLPFILIFFSLFLQRKQEQQQWRLCLPVFSSLYFSSFSSSASISWNRNSSHLTQSVIIHPTSDDLSNTTCHLDLSTKLIVGVAEACNKILYCGHCYTVLFAWLFTAYACSTLDLHREWEHTSSINPTTSVTSFQVCLTPTLSYAWTHYRARWQW